jgi:predicted lipid carrier protein YhbT
MEYLMNFGHSTRTSSTSSQLRPLPQGMPAWFAPMHRRLADLVERLPVAPPSFVLARALDRLLLPRLPADAAVALRRRVIAMHVTDFGIRVKLKLGPRGFEVASEQSEVALTIAATSEGFIRLARGQDDPDRLFFERKLLMQGDTELGLVLKNTLDAIGPLFVAARH